MDTTLEVSLEPLDLPVITDVLFEDVQEAVCFRLNRLSRNNEITDGLIVRLNFLKAADSLLYSNVKSQRIDFRLTDKLLSKDNNECCILYSLIGEP